jgi:hypothetical protein
MLNSTLFLEILFSNHDHFYSCSIKNTLPALPYRDSGISRDLHDNTLLSFANLFKIFMYLKLHF